MTDYATTNTTPADPPDPSLTGITMIQSPHQDFSAEILAHGAPRTPLTGGSSVPRSNVGLVFP